MAPNTGMTTRRGTKRTNSGDTIEVKQKISTITISDNSENEASGKRVMRSATRKSSSTGGTNRPWGRKGKAPVQAPVEAPASSVQRPVPHAVGSAPVPGDDDYVEEYDFTSEDEFEDEEDEDLLEDEFDAKSVITVSSEISQDPEHPMSQRPWKDFNLKMREQWELMYSTVTMHPINGSWETTEDYQREKDTEMLRYMEDFPLAQWVIPNEQANQAYFRLLERTRWRSLGARIYGRERIPEWIPGSTNAAHNQQPLHPPREMYPRKSEPPRHGSGPPPPPPGHQQQHPGPMPPQQGMHPPPRGPPMGSHLPPPPTLPSQPHAQPIPVPPGVVHPGPNGPQGPHRLSHGPPQGPPHGPLPPGMGRPVGVPQTMTYGGWPPGQMMNHTNFPAPLEHPKPRKGKEKKEATPPNSTPPPPPPTPPYALRKKPVEKKSSSAASSSKAGRKNARRQAEAEEFPWTRDLNFREEKAKAKWNDGIYDPETLTAMEATRKRNVPIIDELDAKVQEQQRVARAAKKNKQKQGPDSDDGDGDGKKEKKKREGRKGESGGDPYHSGAFAFASSDDEEYALGLGYKTPDEALEASASGKLEADKQAKIKICWNPGKKGTTENLEQAKFTIRDTIATRKQLETTPILTKRAAECIVDFCPDMLWRGMLLRITSEAGYGNKDVRDRFCYNGCYCDKATITKRISAALGQKQIQPKSRGYLAGELEWYDENVKDFSKYIDYFGKRSTHRNMLKIQMQNERRKQKQREKVEAAKADGDGESDDEAGPSKKDADGDEIMDDDGDEGDEDGHESDGSDDSNAVSVQDSDILDKMED